MLIQIQPRHGDKPENSAFTPSRLLSCFRKPVLEEQNDYYLDLDYQYASMRGTTVHAGMETIGKATEEPGTILREVRFTTLVDTKYGPQEFSAQPDYVLVDTSATDGTVHIGVKDFKTGDVDHDLTEASRDYQMQANQYAWILQRELGKYLLEKHEILSSEVVVDWIEIQYLGATKPRRFTSLGPLYAKGKRIAGTKPQQFEELECAPVILLPAERVEKFVRARIEAKMKAREVLPPILPKGKDTWCWRCPVYGYCMSKNNEENAA